MELITPVTKSHDPPSSPKSYPQPSGSKYPIIIYSPNCNLHNYYPKPKYLITGSFGPLGQQAQTLTLLSSVETFGLGGLRMFTRRSCGFRL